MEIRSLGFLSFLVALASCGQQYSIDPTSLADVGIDPSKDPTAEIVLKNPDGTSTTTPSTGTGAGTTPSTGTSNTGTPVASSGTPAAGTTPTTGTTAPSAGTTPSTGTTPTTGSVAPGSDPTKYTDPDAPTNMVSKPEPKTGDTTGKKNHWCLMKDHQDKTLRCSKGDKGLLEMPKEAAQMSGGSTQKTALCHAYTAKDGTQKTATILVGSLTSVQAHLADGDTAGACASSTTTSTSSSLASYEADCKSGDAKKTVSTGDKSSTYPDKTGYGDKTPKDGDTTEAKGPPVYEKCEDTTVAASDS